MKRYFFISIVCLSLIVLAFGMAYGAKYNIKFGLANEPSHYHSIAAKKFGEIIRERTKGDIKVAVFPASQLGTEDEMISLTQEGTIQMCTASPGHVGNFVKEFHICLAPYIWRDSAHLKKVMEGYIGQDMAGKLLKKTGIKVMSFLWINGHRHLTTAKTPVYSPADLKNVKIRAPQAAIYVAAVKSLGANPVPIEFSELYMALQQGVVEGEENAYGTIEAKKFYEVQKYIMETGHILQSQVCMINNQFFQSLPKEYQTIVQEAADEAAVYNNKLYDESIEKGRQKFTKLGITIIRPPELKIEQFREGAKQLVPELVKIWGEPELYNKIISIE